MKHYEPKDVRNIGLLAHGGAGKTTLGEAFLFNAKATTRLCKVDDGNSNLDFEPEEIRRRSTISTSFATVEWKKRRITLVDMPGDFNFFTDTRNCIFAVDAGVIVVSAVDGVEVGTEKVWELLEEKGLPRAIFVNKLDRERADFTKTLADIRESLSPTVVPLTLPIGTEANFKGIIDLLENKALFFEKDGSGTFTEGPIPADMADEVEEARTNLIESVAESDEALMERYLESGELASEDISTGLTTAIGNGSLIPLLCGSALHNVGVSQLMDIVGRAFPSPVARATVMGLLPGGDEPVERAAALDAPFSAYVFKTIVDPFAGRLSVFRIMSGKLPGEGQLFNATLRSRETYNRVYLLQGKKQETVASAAVGDIVAIAKLKEVKTGASLADESAPILYQGLPKPSALISFALKPRNQGEEDKVAVALQRLAEEDAAMEVVRDDYTGQLLLQGMGQVHVENIVEKMKRKFGVEVDLSIPKVPYRETIKSKVEFVEGKHKKQTGGRGQFGVCYIDVEPLPRGEGFKFVDAIFGGSIPRNYIPAVEKGVIESAERGYLAGFPVVDFQVTLKDGKFHPVDSSEMAFKIAGSLGFKAAMEKARPTLLEPIMNMEITVPEEHMGDIMGDINSRRGRIMGSDAKGKNQIIKAQAPLAEVQRYAIDLHSITGGRGMFTMELSHYEEVPAQNQEKIIEAHKAEEK